MCTNNAVKKSIGMTYFIVAGLDDGSFLAKESHNFGKTVIGGNDQGSSSILPEEREYKRNIVTTGRNNKKKTRHKVHISSSMDGSKPVFIHYFCCSDRPLCRIAAPPSLHDLYQQRSTVRCLHSIKKYILDRAKSA